MTNEERDKHKEEKVVSIIVTIYNGERFLEDTIKALLGQTYKNIELVLVDDGSSDNTLSICNKYKKIDQRVLVISKENGGMSSGRAVGYESISKNNWVLFFDADDIPAPDMVERLMHFCSSDIVLSCFDNRTSSEIMGAPFEFVDDRFIKRDAKFFLDYLQNNNDTIGVLGNLCGVLLNPVFFEKEYPKLYNKREDFPQNFLNDAYCIPRLIFAASDIVFYNNNVYHHRLSKYSDSRRLKPNELAYELLDVQKENLEFFKLNASQEAYEGMLIAYMVIILKLWYQVVVYEDDFEKKERYKQLIEQEFAGKWSRFNTIKCNTIRQHIMKVTITIFAINHNLWKNTVGLFRYGLQYRIKK